MSFLHVISKALAQRCSIKIIFKKDHNRSATCNITEKELRRRNFPVKNVKSLKISILAFQKLFP